MEIKDLFVISDGDPLVGIPKKCWKIDGIFEFRDLYEYEFFKDSLRDTFSVLADDIHVETFGEFHDEKCDCECGCRCGSNEDDFEDENILIDFDENKYPDVDSDLWKDFLSMYGIQK